MSGPRALSRATKPNPADSVDQRDHGGFVRRNLRLGNEAVRHPRFFWSEHESPRSCDFLHVFREGYRAWFHKCSRGFSSFMCPACATVTPEYRPRFSRCCPSRCAARLSLHAGSAHPWPPTLKAARSSFATRSGPPWDLQRLSMGEDGPRRRRRSRRRRPDRRRNPPPGADSRIQTTVSSAYPPSKSRITDRSSSASPTSTSPGCSPDRTRGRTLPGRKSLERPADPGFARSRWCPSRNRRCRRSRCCRS